MSTIHLTKKEFNEKVMNTDENRGEWKFVGSRPAIIDFYASWCGPCNSIAPILEDLSDIYKDKIDIYKVNTDQEQELSAMFGIRSIPSILFIPMGDKPTMLQGALTKLQFEKQIKNLLLK